jgi:hypothetical protein
VQEEEPEEQKPKAIKTEEEEGEDLGKSGKDMRKILRKHRAVSERALSAQSFSSQVVLVVVYAAACSLRCGVIIPSVDCGWVLLVGGVR